MSCFTIAGDALNCHAQMVKATLLKHRLLRGDMNFVKGMKQFQTFLKFVSLRSNPTVICDAHWTYADLLIAHPDRGWNSMTELQSLQEARKRLIMVNDLLNDSWEKRARLLPQMKRLDDTIQIRRNFEYMHRKVVVAAVGMVKKDSNEKNDNAPAQKRRKTNSLQQQQLEIL